MAKATDLFRKALSEIQGEVNTVRSRIRALKAEREELQNGALSADEALAHLGRVIDRHAAEYLEASRSQLAQIALGEPANLAPYMGANEFGHPKNSAIGLICLLLGNEMKARLGEVIQAQPGLTLSRLSGAERAQRLSAIEAELLKLERKEEALICDAESAGIDLPRRPDADPRAVLEVAT